MLGLYVEYSRLAAYAKNVKCMYTSVSGHIVDCREFI